MSDNPEQPAIGESDIAVVGMSARFPGANNIAQFWHNLKNGVESIRFFSDEELAAEGVSAELLSDPTYVKAQPYLEDIDKFDARFFGYSPAEARLIDPQQRLFLECAWEALEDAGYDGLTYPGQIGVYGGSTVNTYMFAGQPLPDLTGDFLSILSGCDKDFLATRVSYKLNLRGPSVTLQTACSTGLVAVHVAAQALLSGECDMALAGGVSIWTLGKSGYLFQSGGIVSPDGHCRAFDADAQGTLFGNGVGIVVLKRLEDALADRDHVYAVVKGSAVNNDGGSKVGFSATSVEGQARVIGEALAMADVDPESIRYIEAHGTGTPLGDPVELEGLCRAFRAVTNATGFCAIGSVKTNIGHMGAASGIAGFIKTALALAHGMMPPSLHFEKPNPQIEFRGSPFYVGAELTRWDSSAGPRRAGVTSLGIGGTNAHAILEQAPPVPVPRGDESAQLVVLSAKTEDALDDATQRLVQYLGDETESSSWSDMAHTLRIGRREFDHRRIGFFRDRAHAAGALASRDPAEVFSARTPTQPASVAFLFPGDSVSPFGVARPLYDQQATLRETIDRCCQWLRVNGNIDPRPLILAEDEEKLAGHWQTENSVTARAALFVVELALAEQWVDWGIGPAAMLGHGIGELVAATLAEVIALEDALRLLAVDDPIISRSTTDTVISIAAPADEIARMLGERLSLLSENGPRESVVAGPEHALAQLATELNDRGVAWQRRRGAPAPPSRPAGDDGDQLSRQLPAMSLSAPRIPFLSGVTGDWISDQQATDPDYWIALLRHPKSTAAGIETLLGEPGRLLLEVGPPSGWKDLNVDRSEWMADLAVLPTLARSGDSQDDVATMYTSLGQLWLAGAAVDWRRVDAHGQGRRVPLPTYPFRRDRFWFDQRQDPPAEQTAKSGPVTSSIQTETTAVVHPRLGSRVRTPLKHVIYDARFSVAGQPFLAQHRFYDSGVVPAVAYLEMAQAAARDAFGQDAHGLAEVLFSEALVLTANEARQVQTILERDSSGDALSFQIHSATDNDTAGHSPWKRHAAGKITLAPHEDRVTTTLDDLPSLEKLHKELSQEMTGDEFYQSLAALGVTLGPGFQVIRQAWFGDEGAVCQLRDTPEAVLDADSLAVDAAFQLFSRICGRIAGDERDGTYVPWALNKFELHQSTARVRWIHVRLEPASESRDRSRHDIIRGSAALFDESRQPVAEISGLQFKRLSRGLLSAEPAANGESTQVFQIEWKPAPAESRGRESATVAPGDWLVLADDDVGSRLAEQLAANGHSYTFVDHGPQFSRSADGRYTIDATDAEHFQRLVASWLESASDCRGIVHAWNLTGGEPDSADGEPCEPQATLGCRSLLYLLQAAAAVNKSQGVKIWSLTRGAVAVNGETAGPIPAQAMAWGLGKTAGLEMSTSWGGLIDIDLGAPDETFASIVKEITAGGQESQIALRRGKRSVARIVAAERPPRQEKPWSAAPDGAYLITGGLGGLGRHTAQWLARHGAKRLYLAGRGKPSDDARAWMATLRTSGVEVQHIQADVSRREDVEQLFTQMAESGIALRGVVHVAGVLDDGVLVRQDWPRFAGVLAPKVQGAWHLHRATQRMPLDFFILYSSIAATFGSPGQSSYAAGNAYLEALTHARRAIGAPALCVHWGPWANVGMSAAAGSSSRRRPLDGLYDLPAAGALDELGRLLDQNATQAIVMRVDWNRFIHQFSAAQRSTWLADVAGSSGIEPPSSPIVDDGFLVRWRQSAPDQRRELLIEHLQARIAAVLGMDENDLPNPDESFEEIGLDSLAGIQLRDTLSNSLDCPLPATFIFDCPTIDAMSEYLLSELDGPTDSLQPAPATVRPATQTVDQDAARLDEFSEDQLAAMLDQRLASLLDDDTSAIDQSATE